MLRSMTSSCAPPRSPPAIGPQAIALPADVSNKAAVDALFDAVLARFGRLDVLVNNAGNIYAARHFLEGDEAWWDKVLNVNLKGAFLCSQRAAHLMARKGSGTIINMSSGGATKAHRGNVAYDASKGGIEAMTRAMALDLAPYGVRVNAIVPGLDPADLRPRQRSGSRTARRPAWGCLGIARRYGRSLPCSSPPKMPDTLPAACLVVDGGVLVQQRSPQVETFPLSRFPELS